MGVLQVGRASHVPGTAQGYRQTVEAVRCAGDVVCSKSEVGPGWIHNLMLYPICDTLRINNGGSNDEICHDPCSC